MDLRAELAEGPFEEGAYVRIFCPFHNDTTTPSGAVYEAHYYCFTCGRDSWRGRYDFLRLLQSRSDITAVSVVSRGTGTSSPVSLSLAESYANILWTQRRERVSWLLERGLDERTIREARLGHTGSKFTIPIFGLPADEGGVGVQNLLAIKYRLDPAYDTCADECTCPKYTNSSGSTASLYFPSVESGLRNGYEGCGTLVLCEGEFDALLLRRYDISSASLTSGAGSGHEILQVLRDMRVVVAYDQDRPGQRGALRVRDCIPNSRICTWHVERDEKGRVLPGWPKDVTDYVQMHGIERFRRLARV